MNRQQSSTDLLPRRQSMDHGITAYLLIIFGGYCLALGATMTGLCYGYEKRENFTSVAEGYKLRTDIAGPVLVAGGGVGVIIALVLIFVFRVCAGPEWSINKTSGSVSSKKSSANKAMEPNRSI